MSWLWGNLGFFCRPAGSMEMQVCSRQEQWSPIVKYEGEKRDLGKSSASLRLNWIFRDVCSILFRFRMHRVCHYWSTASEIDRSSSSTPVSGQMFTQVRNCPVESIAWKAVLFFDVWLEKKIISWHCLASRFCGSQKSQLGFTCGETISWS